MRTIKYNLIDPNSSILENRLFFEDNYPFTLHIYFDNDHYQVYETDAKIISILCHIPITERRVLFGKSMIKSVVMMLKHYKINYSLININKKVYEINDYLSENGYLKFINNNKNN